MQTPSTTIRPTQGCTPPPAGVFPPVPADNPALDYDLPNPGMRLSLAEAATEWARMRASPVPLVRPVVVLDGWHSPGVTAWGLSRRLCSLTSRRRADFAWGTYIWALSVDAAARHAVRTIERAGLLGREIDLVGISMGGIVARAITSGVLGVGGPDKVRAVRVFTIASPHKGARLARQLKLDRASVQLRPGSEVLRRLDEVWPDRGYELTPYALRNDWLVGEGNTAPPGLEPHWVEPSGPIAACLSHFASIYDRRVQIDIARRLRGEDVARPTLGN